MSYGVSDVAISSPLKKFLIWISSRRKAGISSNESQQQTYQLLRYFTLLLASPISSIGLYTKHVLFTLNSKTSFICVVLQTCKADEQKRFLKTYTFESNNSTQRLTYLRLVYIGTRILFEVTANCASMK